MVAAMVVGILSVTAVHSKTITFSPIFVGASINQSYNFTITSGAGSATINEVRITKPADFSEIYCLNANPVGGWSCAANGTRASLTYVEFTGGELAAGALMSINITATSAAGAANYTFDVRTQGTGEAANTSKVNVTVDAHPPMVDLVNVSDGTTVLSRNEMNGFFFLKNTTTGIIFVINVTDNSSGMAQGAVNFYYNVSNLSVTSPLLINYRNDSTANVSVFAASNGSYGQLGLYNVTLNISALPTLNGSRVAFMIVANDSVHNGNVSNASVVTSSYVYNFTIDAVAPQFVDVIITNQSLNASTARGINITSVLTSKVEYILNSSLFLNLSVLVRDDGGSGTVKVEVMNRTGGFMLLDLLTGANGSSTQTTWKINATTNVSGGNGNYNISDLVVGFAGDGLYNITFRATDNVSNVNNTYNFTVKVDDTPPTVSVTTYNLTSVLAAGNVTLSNTTLNNTGFVLRVITSDDINNNTANVSVEGNLGLRYNFTYESGTSSGTSVWNLTVQATTLINITNFCTFGSTASTFGPDASTCNFQFNVSDVMGRNNGSINLTIAVDGLIPSVLRISPVSLTKNYTGTAVINVSVNDTVGPISNVSFRIRKNMTAEGSIEGFYNNTHINVTNVTNWIPMTLGTGSNTLFVVNGTWNFTVNLTALNFSEDINYTIEFNITDSVGRQNTSVNVSNVVFDSSAPTNITVMSGLDVLATNSFQKAMFNVTANATEITSGLLNVSFRIENNSFNWPWVDGIQVVTALTAGQGFNASQWNFTHWGGEATNATNGNFTLRLNVTDTAGNQNTSVTINFTIDTIVPAVEFVYPGNNQNQSGNFTVNASVIESNINTVRLRWENGTITNGNSNNGTFGNNPMTYNLSGSRANATFTNLTDGSRPLMFDSNYTIRLNVTDKAGNINDTVYIQLVLDNTPAKVVAQFPAANSIQTGNFLVNMTFNDNLTVAGTSAASVVNSSNINSSAYRIENNTFNGSWTGMPNVSTDFAVGNVDRNRTNATFTFAGVANGRYDIRFWVNDTAGNQNSSVLITNVTLDNIAPGVAVSIVNVSPAASGGTGLSGTISFNATVTDNLPLNISIANDTTVISTASIATYGVFYRFENATHTLNWTSMSTPSFFNTVHNNTGVEHKAVFNASNITTTLADGDYTVRINATDIAGNQNTTQTMSITVQNGGSKVRATNLTFQGGFVTGSDTNQTSPTFLVNTTTNATCLYSIDTPVTNYDYFLPQTSSNTMGNNISRQHSTALGFRPDRAANGYSTYYVCKDVGGNFTATDGATSTFTFGVDTRNFFNITMGSGGTNKVRGDYFAVGWNSFTLPKTTLLSNTGVPTNYNVTNVLSSLGNSRLTTANFTVLYAHNGSDWAVYRVGGGANTFSNFTADTPTATYYLNITVDNERLEIN